jgi:hypothetical protein
VEGTWGSRQLGETSDRHQKLDLIVAILLDARMTISGVGNVSAYMDDELGANQRLLLATLA